MVERVRLHDPPKKKRGGKIPGSGRKVGTRNKLIKAAVERAKQTGELPHEFLLRVTRCPEGQKVDGHKVTFEERVEAAKAAAPYFAPKLASTTVHDPNSGMKVLNISPRDLLELTDDELEHLQNKLVRLQSGVAQHSRREAAAVDENIYARTLNP